MESGKGSINEMKISVPLYPTSGFLGGGGRERYPNGDIVLTCDLAKGSSTSLRFASNRTSPHIL